MATFGEDYDALHDERYRALGSTGTTVSRNIVPNAITEAIQRTLAERAARAGQVRRAESIPVAAQQAGLGESAANETVNDSELDIDNHDGRRGEQADSGDRDAARRALWLEEGSGQLEEGRGPRRSRSERRRRAEEPDPSAEEESDSDDDNLNHYGYGGEGDDYRGDDWRGDGYGGYGNPNGSSGRSYTGGLGGEDGSYSTSSSDSSSSSSARRCCCCRERTFWLICGMILSAGIITCMVYAVKLNSPKSKAKGKHKSKGQW